MTKRDMDNEAPLPHELSDRLHAACDGVGAAPEELPGAIPYVYGRTAAGRELRLFVFARHDGSDRPAVMLFFGGGFERGDVRAFAGQAEALADLGYVVVLPDYQVFCRDRTTPLAAVEDGRRAYEWLFSNAQRLGIDPRRVILGGGSAGGEIALMCAIEAADERKPVALVLFNPSATLVPAAAAFGITTQEAASVSPLEMDLDGLPSTIIFHGTADNIVPVESSKCLHSNMIEKDVNCELILYEGLNHGFFNSREFDPQLGTSPYADTLSRTISFIKPLSLEPGR